MCQKNLKPIPHFVDQDEEREFWATHDSTDYVDWSKAVRGRLFPNLKRSDGVDTTDASDLSVPLGDAIIT